MSLHAPPSPLSRLPLPFAPFPAFTFRTILRDLLVRYHSLNAGAANMREISSIYSKLLAEDGRDLKIESGSRRSLLQLRLRRS